MRICVGLRFVEILEKENPLIILGVRVAKASSCYGDYATGMKHVPYVMENSCNRCMPLQAMV